MSESAHTPGPWSVIANSWQFTTIYDAKGVPVCRLDLEDWGVTEDNQDELEAKQAQIACKIAAAPDLLTALKGLLRDLGEDDGASYQVARAAIARAEGKND